MAYKHEDKTSGQLIRSADWNLIGHSIEDLQNTKVDRAGDTIGGSLSVAGKISAADAAFTSSLNVSGPVNLSSNLIVSGLSNMGDVTTGNLSVNGTLHANYVRSAQFRVTSVFYDTPGNGGSMAAGFSSGGGTLMIFAAGSGYRAAGGQIGMFVFIDGRNVGIARSFTNEANSHKTFSTGHFIVAGIPAGGHTMTLTLWNSTITDGNDFFNVSVLELPF